MLPATWQRYQREFLFIQKEKKYAPHRDSNHPPPDYQSPTPTK